MYLGIEIGGTKLQLGVSDGSGPGFRGFVRMDVDRAAGASGILEQIKSAAPGLITSHDVERVGFGFGGPVDMASGNVIKSHHVRGWDNFALCAWSQSELDTPAVIGNDCDVAALAEAKFGAGRDHRIVFYVTVGTGVGGGLVVDNRLYAEHRFTRTELGHLRPGLGAIDVDDIVEAQACGPGIANTVRRLLDTADDPADEASLFEAAGVDHRDKLNGKNVADAARAGHTFALAAYDRATRALGWAIAQSLTLTAAEVVVVGGGVSLAGDDLFFDPLRERVEEYVFPPLRERYEIVSAGLGEDVVVVGGVVLAAAQ